MRSVLVHGEETTAGTRWHECVAKFKNFLCAYDIGNYARKKAHLLHYARDDVFEIVDTMTDAQKGIGAIMTAGENSVPTEYSVLKKSLEEYFTPKKNIQISCETLKFRQRSQKDDEKIDTYHSRLRGMASLCDFYDVDKEILAHIIPGSTSSRVRRMALEDNMYLQKILEEARNHELSDSKAATAIKNASAANAISINVNAYNVIRDNRVHRGQRGHH